MEVLTDLVSYVISELTIEIWMSLMNQRRMFMVHFLMLLLFMPVPCNKLYLWTIMSGMKQLD